MRIDIEDDMVGASGYCRDQSALDDLVRRVLQQKAVLERPGLVFVAVADDELVTVGSGSDRRPFAMRWESGAAHPAQVRLSDLGDDRRRIAQGLGESLSADTGEPGIQVGADADVFVQEHLIRLFHGALRGRLPDTAD